MSRDRGVSVENWITRAVLKRVRAHRNTVTGVEINRHGAAPFERPVTAICREARYSDFDSVAALKLRYGLGADAIQNWARLWQNNPAVAKQPNNWRLGWVLEAHDRIVGYI